MAIRIGLWDIEDSLTDEHFSRLGRYLDLLEKYLTESRNEWEQRVDEEGCTAGRALRGYRMKDPHGGEHKDDRLVRGCPPSRGER